MSENTTWEWCQNCDEEVELPLILGLYHCPNCGEKIINCSMCENVHCVDCKIRENIL